MDIEQTIEYIKEELRWSQKRYEESLHECLRHLKKRGIPMIGNNEELSRDWITCRVLEKILIKIKE